MLSLWDFHQELGKAVSHPFGSLPSTKQLQDLKISPELPFLLLK
jgi:hypothetical protein